MTSRSMTTVILQVIKLESCGYSKSKFVQESGIRPVQLYAYQGAQNIDGVSWAFVTLNILNDKV